LLCILVAELGKMAHKKVKLSKLYVRKMGTYNKLTVLKLPLCFLFSRTLIYPAVDCQLDLQPQTMMVQQNFHVMVVGKDGQGFSFELQL